MFFAHWQVKTWSRYEMSGLSESRSRIWILSWRRAEPSLPGSASWSASGSGEPGASSSAESAGVPSPTSLVGREIVGGRPSWRLCRPRPGFIHFALKPPRPLLRAGMRGREVGMDGVVRSRVR
jgi:hypothetical protein